MSDLHIDLTAPNGLTFKQPLGLFIDNEWVSSSKGAKISTINPANEEEICAVHAADSNDVDKAVEAARRAFNGEWRELDTSVRGELLYKLSDLVEQHGDVLATIDAMDNGKTFQAARNVDIVGAIALLRYYAGWADKIHGKVIDPNPDKLAYVLREPIGVCGAIIPWNFPLLNIVTKLAPALAAGNTIVVKVAEQTPLSALYFANLVKEVGIPAGVVNVLNGAGREVGSAIAAHPGIDMITFTGSTPTGRQVMKTAAGTLKRVTLETGGKSPLLVFPDADLEQAVRWGHRGIMSNQGQVCSATSRILVHADIYDTFVIRFKAEVEKISKVGDPFQSDTFQGPQVTKDQFNRVLSYVEAGKQEGAQLVCGGAAFKNVGGKGLYIAPTVFAGVTDSMAIAQEEVFGPFVVIAPFHDEAEAIERANSTIFGLGASVFTRDISRALRVSKKIQSGTIWVNSSNDDDVRVPFGGYKQSGFGREMGEEGIEPYTITKSIHVNLNSKL
ncbi:aldehyde dehydrogenase [Aspergillus campestris IBT 28561]|uniref:aldehyde dehydrogenase (NAD(+)) n=1 Tax=Aspergillus campestris (strain IBT 28561) TaxID=1392248 RepID=A0A2I1CXV3_ASPC2|nr:aldehyde dehydrogenase [Aspergillus campestris IBT 28561]PKY02460.1 aldehyde dehydrogenase [Aspergillus campestris IBT 28561]